MLPTTVKTNRYALGNSREAKIKVTLVTARNCLLFNRLRVDSAPGEVSQSAAVSLTFTEVAYNALWNWVFAGAQEERT